MGFSRQWAVMQCQSYFPSYNSHYDLNMDNNGGVSKPIYNDNRVFQSGYYKNHSSSLPVAEFFRQTIVMQEVTFRDQVRELHRIYIRQKELMGEKSGESSTVQESKCKKIGGKFLDLELPAEEYIDVEECGFSEDRKSPNPPNLIEISSNAPMASSPISFAQKTNMVDLNEPLIASSDYEDEIIDAFNNHLGCSNSSTRLDLNSAFVEEEGGVDLNLSINDDGLPQRSLILHQTILKVNSEAPISPEVEERPPPRGDSENCSDDSLEELVKIAANAIVSISSSESQPLSPENCEIFDTVTLEWFAGLVLNSVSNDLKTHALDEFEAMTLNLTETKKEEHFENFSSYSTPVSIEIKTGRRTTTRTPKRKDFQREVLPSIASLSRYEVTEDINLIEVLMEAAGTPWHLSRAKRGTKPRDKKPILSESKSQVKGWGKDNRRPRGQRSPASPTSVLSKWLAYSI